MAFWGIEVKPGKPITHYCEKARGRLRISQATLGIGEAAKRTTVQCNVANRSPVFLCALLPNKTESCHLDLEFEEADDVVFSVLGPRSVYLTGYYVQRIRQSDPHSDTETYGVDIDHTPTEGSSYCSDDDNYEDSFINDDGDDDKLQVFSQSPVVNNRGTDEATLDNDKLKDRKGLGRQRRKKYRVFESDNDANSHETEDADGDPSSVLKSKRTVMIADAEEQIPKVTVEMGDEAKDASVCVTVIEPKEKVDQLADSGRPQWVGKLPSDEEKTEVRDEKNELPKEVENLDEIIVSNEKVLIGDGIHENRANNAIGDQKLPQSIGNDQMQSPILSEISAKSKKKRKKCSKKVDNCNNQTDNEDCSVLGEDREHEVEVTTNMEIDENSEDGQKSKKRRNELQWKGTNIEGTGRKKYQNVLTEDKFEQGSQHADNLTRDPSVEDRENQEQPGLEDIRTEETGSVSHDISKEDKSMQISPRAGSIEDQPLESEGCPEQQLDNIISMINKEILVSDGRSKKRIKKKKKTQAERELNTGLTNMLTDSSNTTSMDYEDKTANAAPISETTLSNELIIEELAGGPPDGKVATPGRKVKIHYTAMLKATGHVFDSNVGKPAFQFRLGDDEYIDGWNIGINGMHVGDKRRLTIPPSMGFGDHGMGEDVPPNSWLVYDIELIGVRK
ncbi:hypothetical protein OROGR_031976 [Orobanche gracilis]